MKSALRIIQACQGKLSSLRRMLPISEIERRMEHISELTSSPSFWSDNKKAISLNKEYQYLSDLQSKLKFFSDEISFYLDYINSCPEETDIEISHIDFLYSSLSKFEIQQMMKGESDNLPAIVSISAGAGGTESSNWVSMLLRMYCRYANNQGFAVEILDEKPSEEHSSICTDSVSIRVEGSYAFGFFKGESGVHRLIRNSPFNAGNARQTSFAAVYVTPDIEDTIDIKIEEKDIEITAQTAGGSGGQHQNKVSSAVRLKHIPSGINILVRNERDQHANRRIAMKMLKSKLYEIELEKKRQEKDKEISSLSDVSFGSQIRTYTLQPYSLCKDHRTGCEINNAEKVLDGEIHELILSYLSVAG